MMDLGQLIGKSNHAVNRSGRQRGFEIRVYGGRPVTAVVMLLINTHRISDG